MYKKEKPGLVSKHVGVELNVTSMTLCLFYCHCICLFRSCVSQLSDSLISLCLSYWILIVICFSFYQTLEKWFFTSCSLKWLMRFQHLDIGQSKKKMHLILVTASYFSGRHKVTHFNNDGVFFINSVFPETLTKDTSAWWFHWQMKDQKAECRV